jgi:hypothetical protein
MFSAGNNTFLYFEGMKLDQSIVLFSTILSMSFICILKNYHPGGRCGVVLNLKSESPSTCNIKPIFANNFN